MGEHHSRRSRLSSVVARARASDLAFRTGYHARSAGAILIARRRDVQEPVFVWGAGRTGSTLLYDLLSVHPDVICYRVRQRTTKGLYGTEHWGGGGYQEVVKNPFPPQEGIIHYFGPKLADLRAGGSLDERELALIRASYRRLAASSLRRRRLVDKSPPYTFLVPVLDKMFPDARHVHCVRRPVAVVNGYLRRMIEGRNVDSDGFWGWKPAGWESMVAAPVEDKAVWLVTNTVRQGMADRVRLGDRCTEVRYETLVTGPRQELKRVLTALGFRVPAGLLDRIPQSFPDYTAEPPDLGSVDPRLLQELEEVTSALGYQA